MRELPEPDIIAIAHEAMLDYGFNPYFPHKVLKEVPVLVSKAQQPAVLKGMKDYRDLLWSSIDNIDSKDLDQLEYCQKVENEEIRVFIAIADVDHYVTLSSFTDHHAHQNGSTVYTGVQIFPMIPDTFSANLTSLIEGEDRVAIVIEYFVGADGTIRFGEIVQALVHNKAKLVYEDVGEWLENSEHIPERLIKIPELRDQVKLQAKAATLLRNYRLERGALELNVIEAFPVIEDHKIVDLKIRNKTRAHLIIENFMIAANQTMVNCLETHEFPHIQRIVRVPKRWSRIVEVAQSLGYELPLEPDAKALANFLDERRRVLPEQFPDLSLTVVKLLGRGEYVLTEANQKKFGHFGLVVRDYTHSTAPNRRYIDLVIQRLVKAALQKKIIPYTKSELFHIATWCSERDQMGKKVERFMQKVAACFLLKDRVGDYFEGIVTGVTPEGVFVRIHEPPVEGRIMHGDQGLDVGEVIRVRLIKLNPEKGFIDFDH